MFSQKDCEIFRHVQLKYVEKTNIRWFKLVYLNVLKLRQTAELSLEPVWDCDICPDPGQCSFIRKPLV